jgi:hypothetical protein
VADVLVKAISIHQAKGLRRPGRAGDWIGAGAIIPIFGIVGGAIIVKALYGHCTTAAGTATTTPRMGYNPTANPGQVNISAAVGAAATPINTLFTWSGVAAGLLTRSALGWMDATTATEAFVGGYMTFGPGVINYSNAAVVDNALVVDWYIFYEAVDIGTVVSAL